jgi:cell division protein FtsB
MTLFKRIATFFTNKYLLAGLFFLVWMSFFDEKDLASDYNKRMKYKELQQSEQHFSQLINESKQELGQLKTNAATIERYAREKYMMKKDNEDLFIVSAEQGVK